MHYLPRLEVEVNTATADADAAVIWLHGLGADGHDFEPVVPELGLPARLRVRFVFPHAPAIPVTINGGLVMPAWYDILAMDIDRKVDLEQVREAAARVLDLVEREIGRGIDSRRIILAGFSQGGAVAIEAALSSRHPLGGLLALSTYFATRDRHPERKTGHRFPVLVCHGEFDPVVPEELGRRAVRDLQELGFEPGYRTWPMDHAVCREEIHAISAWLQQRWQETPDEIDSHQATGAAGE